MEYRCVAVTISAFNIREVDPVKLLVSASLFATLFVASMARADEVPSTPQPVRGLEGPDVRHTVVWCADVH